jgi:DNA repair photolyase
MTIIYVPKTDAFEYAPLAINLYRGCGHSCKYCYVPSTIHMKRAEFDAGVSGLKVDYWSRLRRDSRQFHGSPEQIMLSFTSDPYHPGRHDANPAYAGGPA